MNLCMVLAIFTFISQTAPAGKLERGCEVHLTEARVRELLREEHGFDQDVVEQASYVNAELSLVTKTERQPVVFVVGPSQNPLVFTPSRDGGQTYGGSNVTQFIYVGSSKIAVLDDGVWRTSSISSLDASRDPRLKAFVAKNEDALANLSRRYGYYTRDLLQAKIYRTESASIIRIRNSQGGGDDHYWVDRDSGDLESIDVLFPDRDRESARVLSDDQILYRYQADDGSFAYRIVASLAKRAGEASNPATRRLIKDHPILTTRLTLGARAFDPEQILNAETVDARYEGDESKGQTSVRVLMAGKHSTHIFAVIDQSLSLSEHNRHFEQTQHVIINNDLRLNVRFVEGAQRIDAIYGRRQFEAFRATLQKPVAADFFRQIGANSK